MLVKDRAPSAPPLEMPPAVAEKKDPPDRVAKVTVIVFACFIGVLILAAAFFTDRNGDVDELMMYNPSYMLAHSGKLTFPSYSYRSFYDLPVINHPPIHLGSIGLLEKAGLTWYYAEATPTVVFLVLGILVIVLSPFPPPVKLALLFSIGFIVSSGEAFFVTFGVRPEGEAYAAWFAGLALLESGRLASWNRQRLFAGAFLLTWASGVHYYACVALAGVVVYALWAVLDLGRIEAESRVAALIAGGCLFGVPYLALYLAPHLKDILSFVQITLGDAGLGTSVRLHMDIYKTWAHFGFIPALLRKPMGLGIPLFLLSTVLLGVVRSTRGIALAALPLQLFVFLFAAHKLPNYLIHEIALFAAAVAVSILALGGRLWRLMPAPWLRTAFLPAAAVFFAGYLIFANATLKAATFWPPAHVHEAELARAAARQILGPHARVTGRDGAWYTSGADYWWDIERDMLQSSHYDPASFFSNFDAAVDYAHQSDTGASGTISAWYADGTLKLRGFYLGATNEQLQILFLATRRAPQVVGYAASGGQMYRFEERPAGEYQVLSAVCPMIPQLERQNWISRWPGTFSAALYLPSTAPGDKSVIATILAPRSLPEPAGWMHSACTEITSLTGTLTPIDKHALLEQLRHEDTLIHFPRLLDELPGYRGVILPETLAAPKQTARLDGVADLSKIQPSSDQARVERLPQVRVTTIPLLGAFSATIPVSRAEAVTTPCWVQVRLKVISGEIGLAAFGTRGIVAGTTVPILKSANPIDVALELPSLRDVNQIIIFNASSLAGAQVDVLDAAILVTPDDFNRNHNALAALK